MAAQAKAAGKGKAAQDGQFRLGVGSMTYGCFNRDPFYSYNELPARWPGDEPLRIPNRMAMDCQYAIDDKYADPGCVGCKHKEQHEE